MKIRMLDNPYPVSTEWTNGAIRDIKDNDIEIVKRYAYITIDNNTWCYLTHTFEIIHDFSRIKRKRRYKNKV